MASEVDICNLALANLGDTATIASINPPDQSAQAAHCARFYPIVRDAVLEMHPWSFTTKRVALASVANPSTTWTYAYAAPSNVLNYLAVLPQNAIDDYSVGQLSTNTIFTGAKESIVSQVGAYSPQAFALESVNSAVVILTNQANAVLRYTASITDSGEFPPSVVNAIAALLSSYLAGPLIKGSEGRAASKDAMALFSYWKEKAIESDGNSRKIKPQINIPWIADR